MRRLIAFILNWYRRFADGSVARAMLFAARRNLAGDPFVYLDWYAQLVRTTEGCLILVAGRRSTKAKLEDIAMLLGALVRASDSKDPAMPPFQVVSPRSRFVAWGWHPDGRELSAREQTLILSAVLGSNSMVAAERALDRSLN